MLQSVSLENEGAYLCTAANALGKAVSASVLHLLGECPVLLAPDGSFICKTQGQDLWTLESKVNGTGVSRFSPPCQPLPTYTLSHQFSEGGDHEAALLLKQHAFFCKNSDFTCPVSMTNSQPQLYMGVGLRAVLVKMISCPMKCVRAHTHRQADLNTHA